MKVHNLKIKLRYFNSVESGEKTFELRNNDRDYQAGDYIRFSVIDEDGQKIDDGAATRNLFNDFMADKDKLYKITYVLKNVPEYGLNRDYCILSIRKATKNDQAGNN